MKEESNTIVNSGIEKTIFIVLLLFSIHLWDIRFIPQKFKVENFLVWIVCGYCFVMVLQKKDLRFRNAIIFFLFGLALNSIAAYINLGQSPVKTILSYEYFYFILIYFLLHYFKFSRKYLEDVIIIFGVIYALLYVLQALVYPFLLLSRNVVRLDKGEFQFAILGHGFLMLAYFLCLNRYLLYRRFKSLILALLLFVVLLMCNYRTLIGGAILLTMYMSIKIIKFSIRDFALMFLLVLLLVGLFQFKGVSKILEQSITYTQDNIKEGKKYVRLVQMEFFFKRYPQNLSYFVIGGGKPSRENLYRFNPSAIGMNYNIVWVDIGLFGFYIVIGGLALAGMLWYTFKAIFIKIPREAIYLNFYFLYLLIVSFTNEEIYRDGIFCVHAIGLYLIDLAANEKQESIENNMTKEQ